MKISTVSGPRALAFRRSLRAPALALLSLTTILVACAREEPAPPVPAGTPRLVLFVVVDQLRADYLERFRPLLTGGLDRLLRDGLVFADAHQNHNVTATGPGHATLSTGAFPSSHGIVGNDWWSRERGASNYCLYDAEHTQSPVQLLRPTLGDQLKATWPDSKVFALGGKDRSAVLTAGHHADGAYWYDRGTGGVVTSTYYRKGPQPGDTPWLKQPLESGFLDQYFGLGWTPIVSEEQWPAFDVEPLDRGPFTRRFPYALGGLSPTPDPSFYSSIYGTPFLDAYMVELAKAAIVGEELGMDETPDFLGVTLSALDAVGHTYGPDAPETLDTLLRVDRVVGELLEFVDQRIGLDQVVVSLSADHGVGRVPEVRQSRGLEAGRINDEGILCIQQAGQKITSRFGLEGSRWMPSFLYFDQEILDQAGVEKRAVATALAKELGTCPRISKVFLPEDIVRELDPPLDELYTNGYLESRSADLLILLESNTLFGSTVASHGQAYRYDTHVPWLLLAPDRPGAIVEQRVATADVAPTLASSLGIGMPDADGVDLSGILP